MYKYFCVFIVIFFLSNAYFACAQTSVVLSTNIEPITAKTFVVQVAILPGDEVFNAFDIELLFPQEVMTLVSFQNSGSIATAWITDPHVSGNAIYLQGIIAGGYQYTTDPLSGEKISGKIIDLVFEATDKGSGVIAFVKKELYIHDGKATIYTAQGDDFPFSITDLHELPAIPDTVSPLPFMVYLDRTADLFEGRFFLVFQTQDTQSGIAGYFVREGNDSWKEAKSPYVLEDQKLLKRIEVKAVDFAGNERIVEVKGKLESRIMSYGWMVVGMLLIFATVYLYVIRKNK